MVHNWPGNCRAFANGRAPRIGRSDAGRPCIRPRQDVHHARDRHRRTFRLCLLAAALSATPALPADIDPIARTGPDQTETPATALRCLDGAEQPVRFTGKQADDGQRPKSDETAGATLGALLADVDNHELRMPVKWKARCDQRMSP
jgi:hypothetical protein